VSGHRVRSAGAGQGPDDLVMARAAGGVRSRLLPILHRPAGIVAVLEVDGQLRGDLWRPGAIRRLQTQAQTLVQVRASSARQPFVGHLLIEGMHKPVTHRRRAVWPEQPLCRTQQVALHQRLTARLCVQDVLLERCGHRRHGKRDPGHTGRLDHPLHLRGQALELVLQHLAQVVWDLKRHRVKPPLECPAPVVGRQHPPAHQRFDHGHEKQGTALRDLVEHRAEGRGQALHREARGQIRRHRLGTQQG
jgi:hypothetical protein